MLRPLLFVLALLMLATEVASAQVPEARPQSQLSSADDIRADFRNLYDGLQRAHFNLFENETKAEYERLYRQMDAEIRFPEDRLDVARRFQRFVAFGRIAHARIDSATDRYDLYRDAGGRVFPIFLRFDGRRAFVLENRSGLAAIEDGDELLAINGIAIGTWFDRLRPMLSADSDYMASALLEWRFHRLLWLEIGNQAAFPVTILRDGAPADVLVPARTAAEINAVERKGRLQLDPEVRTARLFPGRIAYLRPGPFYNTEPGAADMYDGRAFRAFVDHSMKSFNDAGATSLLIDLRDNPGGDNSFSDYLVSWFARRPFRFASSLTIKVSPETTASNAARLATTVDRALSPSTRMADLYRRSAPGQLVQFPVDEGRPRGDGQAFRGRVYVLADRHSYSNAALVAALVQDYRFGLVLGEETSDLATTLGALETFTLPRTKIVVSYPKARIVRPSGSKLRRGVVPDIAIPTPTVQDDSDPVLRRALQIIAGTADHPAGAR